MSNSNVKLSGYFLTFIFVSHFSFTENLSNNNVFMYLFYPNIYPKQIQNCNSNIITTNNKPSIDVSVNETC